MIRRIIHFILILLGIAIIGLSLLTSTQPGLTLLIKSIPGVVSVKHVDGSLLHGWHIQDLHYKQDSLQLNINDIQLTWSPRHLLSKTVMISSLTAEGITVNRRNTQASRDETRSFNTSYNLPINIATPNITLKDIQITNGNSDEATKLNSIHLNAHVTNNILNIHQFKIHSPYIDSSSSALIKLTNIKDI